MNREELYLIEVLIRREGGVKIIINERINFGVIHNEHFHSYRISKHMVDGIITCSLKILIRYVINRFFTCRSNLDRFCPKNMLMVSIMKDTHINLSFFQFWWDFYTTHMHTLVMVRISCKSPRIFKDWKHNFKHSSNYLKYRLFQGFTNTGGE